MTPDMLAEIRSILQFYDLGELAGCVKDERGTVNTSFTILIESDGKQTPYFLRQYKKQTQEAELIFEHDLVSHLVNNGFDLAPRVLRTRDGKTYLHRRRDENDKDGVFCAIFDFLSGEDKYTWVGPVCNSAEVRSSAAVLARYHQAIADFRPRGERSEPVILDLLPVIAAYTDQCCSQSKGTVFDAYLADNLDLLRDSIAETRRALACDECQQQARVIIHCDYHPGNLKFAGDQAVGVFDFDWSKLDLRSFDVGLAIYYFFASWLEADDGALRLDDVRLFVQAYQETLRRPPVSGPGSQPGPLSPVELKYLPFMINAGNLYVLNWALWDFYQKNVDPEKYLVYLRHAVNFIRWFNQPEIRQQLSWLGEGSSKI